MTDQPRIFGKTTAFADTGPDSHHSEMETHRAAAQDRLGGHVHFIGSTTQHIEMFSDDGSPAATQAIMTTKWQLAPPEPVQETPAAE